MEFQNNSSAVLERLPQRSRSRNAARIVRKWLDSRFRRVWRSLQLIGRDRKPIKAPRNFEPRSKCHSIVREWPTRESGHHRRIHSNFGVIFTPCHVQRPRNAELRRPRNALALSGIGWMRCLGAFSASPIQRLRERGCGIHRNMARVFASNEPSRIFIPLSK